MKHLSRRSSTRSTDVIKPYQNHIQMMLQIEYTSVPHCLTMWLRVYSRAATAPNIAHDDSTQICNNSQFVSTFVPNKCRALPTNYTFGKIRWMSSELVRNKCGNALRIITYVCWIVMGNVWSSSISGTHTESHYETRWHRCAFDLEHHFNMIFVWFDNVGRTRGTASEQMFHNIRTHFLA